MYVKSLLQLKAFNYGIIISLLRTLLFYVQVFTSYFTGSINKDVLQHPTEHIYIPCLEEGYQKRGDVQPKTYHGHNELFSFFGSIYFFSFKPISSMSSTFPHSELCFLKVLINSL